MFFGGFPFGDMPGGGFPGGGAGPRSSGQPVDNEKFYKLLAVDKQASPADIKKAYRKLAIQHHPDKGGNEETFKEITKAYEVLSDPEKRQRYDQFGEDAVNDASGGMGGGDHARDVFDMFFGGGRGGRSAPTGPRGKRKGQDVVHPLKLSLEQLYNGVTKKLAVNRDVVDTSVPVRDCDGCDGRGTRVQVIRMGPLIQQSQTTCNSCGGEGKKAKLKKEREVLEVFVPKGSPNNHKIVFQGKGDESASTDAGDVVFVVQEEAHPRFTRKGVDLYVKHKITIGEALCGWGMVLEHLDGRKLLIKSSPGEVVKPTLEGGFGLKAVRNEGMPTVKNPFVRGNLFIVLEIQFPDKMEEKTAKMLSSLLPRSPDSTKLPSEEDRTYELHHTENIDVKESQRTHGGGRRGGEAYDEDHGHGHGHDDDDDEDGRGGHPGVQCRQA
jgi:DnaJ family protein A protein 2